MSGIETERKFLVAGDGYKAMAHASSRIRQGYIPAKGATVRVRMRDERAFLTIKGRKAAGSISRYEFETEITPSEAEELFKLCQGGEVDKRRWLVKSGAHVFEVDEFYGANEGLVVAEVELSREDEAFVRPPFIGKEVTFDPRYRNSYLCKKPFKEW
ncbi:MAG: CYTH domain-containing protein [Prevotella sp.]|nr:CYTH domain-containing protein [Prevotella sp.]MCD8306288.1 CYTH domain-containing protein [Prevotella sp.]